MSPREKAVAALRVYLKRGYEAVELRAKLSADVEPDAKLTADVEALFLAKLAEREAAFHNYRIYAVKARAAGPDLDDDLEASGLLQEAQAQNAALIAAAHVAAAVVRQQLRRLSSVQRATRTYHSSSPGAAAPRFIKGC